VGPFIHHLDSKGCPILVEEIDRRRVLLYLPESVQGEIHRMAEYGEVYEFVAAEEQCAARRMEGSDVFQCSEGPSLDLDKTFPVRHGHGCRGLHPDLVEVRGGVRGQVRGQVLQYHFFLSLSSTLLIVRLTVV